MRRKKIPANHAPISVTLNTGAYRSQDLTETLSQALTLGNYTTEYTGSKATKCKRPIRFREINGLSFTQNIQEVEIPTFQGYLDLWTNYVCDTIYENIRNSKNVSCNEKPQEQSQNNGQN